MNSSMVDWATLPNDLLDLISKSLESSVDLSHFRSVCSSWRSAAQPKPPLPTHHIPVLPDNGASLFPDYAVGFRLSQRSILLIKPHNTSDEADLFGWLVKVEEDLHGHPRKVTLLDPLSKKRHSLPQHFPPSLDMSKFKVKELGREFKLHYFNPVGHIVDSLYSAVVNSLYSYKVVVKYLDASYNFVLLTIDISRKLAVFTSWDRAWTVIDDRPSPFVDVILFDGRFFAVDNNGRTVVVDFVALKLDLVANPVYGGGRKFLVESCGEMLLVDMCFDNEEFTFKFEVFKFLERDKSWVEVKDLGDKMLFLGDDCNFSASLSDLLPPCGGSSVFFDGNVFSGDNLGVFDFKTGNVELIHKLPEYAKLFWPPPPWITSHQRAENHRGETSDTEVNYLCDTCEVKNPD